jgi:putative DNA primase/helicase
LSGDTSLQKLLMVVGPKRSGKGTIGRVLTGLLGVHNTAAPTLASLTTNFGLAPLIVFGDYLASSSLIGERQRIAEHEAATEEEERRRAELREIREAHPPVAN